jgi:hypothetical protein
MKHQLNEVKKLQKIAGILKEEDSSYTVHLKIDGKTVMSRTSDHYPRDQEVSDNLRALEDKYKDKYDFSKAEIVVLNKSGEKVGGMTMKTHKWLNPPERPWPYGGGSNFGGGGQGSLGGL